MAAMFPAHLRPHTQSGAEKLLYELFERQLDERFHVFHSVWWQAPAQRGVRDGEADFVIAHPNLGILVLEVKGGAVGYDGVAGKWFSNEHLIKDPVEQVRQSKHVLLEYLRDAGALGQRWVLFGHAVAFPDIAIDRDLRPDIPREIVLDASGVHEVGTWIDAVFAYYRAEEGREGAPGRAAVERLTQLLAPAWDLRPRMGDLFAREADIIRELTEEQHRLLDFIGHTRRAAIAGCAGSGKTTLAIEKALRMEKAGYSVLLVCFNRALAETLADDLREHARIDVKTFHTLCLELCRRARLHRQPGANDEFFTALVDQTLDAVDKLGPQYDAIVVDEGQDFGSNWWLVLDELLNDGPNGQLYVFYDDNQLLYQPVSSIPLQIAPHPLQANLRNTKHIHDAILPFHRGDFQPMAIGPVGRPVEFIPYESEQQLRTEMRRLLHRLVVNEGVFAGDVVMLTPRSRENSALWSLSPFGNYRLVEYPTGNETEILCTTIHAFKGLETPVVILVEVEALSHRDLANVLYVGGTRARNHLVVMGRPPEVTEKGFGAVDG